MAVFLTPEQLAARNKRSLWIALGLVAFIVLIFTTTFMRMQANLAARTAQQHAIVAAPPSQAPATEASN
jgi:phosphotransferase system  glucose/maltose/N-acetylglucosamine-specific IIC component